VVKRKQASVDDFNAIMFKMALVAGALWVVVSITSKMWMAMLFGIIVTGGIYALMQWMAEAQRRSDITRAVNNAWTLHERALVTQHAKLVQRDVYGREDRLKWDKELARFANHHILPTLKPSTLRHLSDYVDEIFAQIDARVLDASAKDPVLVAFSPDMDPGAFEHFCADALSKAGWSARVTQASADQGVDVVAERKGQVLVLQCKLYSKPVGNKAVQEIAAGRAHERADFAAVCSNQPYTPAAKRLAGTNQVLLLHPSELSDVHERLGQARLSS
jgi:restriction system protein